MVKQAVQRGRSERTQVERSRCKAEQGRLWQSQPRPEPDPFRKPAAFLNILLRERHMKMLIAVDGSEFAEWSVQMLEAVASRPPDSVTLLHVVDSASLKSRRLQAAASAFVGKARDSTGLRAAPV